MLKKISFLFFCLLLFNKVFSQEKKVVRDLHLWTQLTYNHSINNRNSFFCESQIRYNESISSFSKYLMEIGYVRDISKNLNMGASLRYNFQILEENNFEYAFELKYRVKVFSNIKCAYRFRFQNELPNSNRIFNYTFRNQLKLNYKVNKGNIVFLSSELFRTIRKNRDPYFNKVRTFIGYKFNRTFSSYELSFGTEHQLHSNNPYIFYIANLQYTFSLK